MATIREEKRWGFFIALALLLLISLYFSLAVPEGPSSITNVGNTTKNLSSALILNTSGGTITTVNLNASQANLRWKAFVGNVTGKLTLDSSSGATLYDWSLSGSVAGEVYATRNSTSIQWGGLNCTWGVTNNETNRTVENEENYDLNHTSPDDNITATFNQRNHSSFSVGAVTFSANYCYSIYTYVNDTAQFSDFQEIVMYAGTNAYDGDLVYVTLLENSVLGFDNRLYDFQMIVPERGYSGFASSTAYYFYVEVI
ncbi:hypothetical protein HY501_02540 [Candidatus Woesearchaeota archaeon]|nr:hypothetical protein [Candidatus Woesearchaeota archaeon]